MVAAAEVGAQQPKGRLGWSCLAAPVPLAASSTHPCLMLPVHLLSLARSRYYVQSLLQMGEEALHSAWSKVQCRALALEAAATAGLVQLPPPLPRPAAGALLSAPTTHALLPLHPLRQASSATRAGGEKDARLQVRTWPVGEAGGRHGCAWVHEAVPAGLTAPPLLALQYLSWRIWHMRRRHARVQRDQRIAEEESLMTPTSYSSVSGSTCGMVGG